MRKVALRMSGYSFGFGARTVLRDISIFVNEGEFVSILGRNGSGKSTLMRCMTGLIRRGKGVGAVQLFGRPLSKLSRREIARWAAHVPQTIDTVHPFTVMDYLRLSRFSHRPAFGFRFGEQRDTETAVHRALLTVGMQGAMGRNMGELSGGECQKVLIAAALAQETPLLLLDEPTASLDHLHAAELARTLRRIHREEHRTVVLVTHDINLAARLSDRVFALKNGALIFDGKPSDFMRTDVLHRVFDEQMLLSVHPVTGRPLALPSELG